MAFYTIKKNKKWIIKALDRSTRRTIAWVIGNRDAKTFEKLYNKIKHIKDVRYYTDNWSGFSAVLPKNRHFIGKEYTRTIERDNSNTRHHLGRMRTKVVSKKEKMVDMSMKLWCALSMPEIFKAYREAFLSLFV